MVIMPLTRLFTIEGHFHLILCIMPLTRLFTILRGFKSFNILMLKIIFKILKIIILIHILNYYHYHNLKYIYSDYAYKKPNRQLLSTDSHTHSQNSHVWLINFH
jgi:hypothetical protein